MLRVSVVMLARKRAMKRPLLAFAGLIAAGGTAVGVYVAAPDGGEEEVVQQFATVTPIPSATAEATAIPSAETVAPTVACARPGAVPEGEVLYRWGDLTLSLPADGQIVASGDFSPDGEPVVGIGLKSALEKGVVLSAGTGATLADFTTAAEAGAIEATVASVNICAFDPESAPWPYSGDASANPRENFGNLSFIRPEPASGIQIGTATAACLPGSRCVPTLIVRTARSSMAIDSETGATNQGDANVHSLDSVAFERYAKSVRVFQQ